MSRNRVVPLAAVLLFLPFTPLVAQTAASAGAAPPPRPTIEAQRISGESPRIDGRLDEAVWSAAQPVSSFVQRQPNPGAAATERTEARVLYDREAVYVGLRLYDRDPGRISAPLLRRDGGADNSDWAYVMLDSNDDRRTAFVFAVNPRGVQKDWFVADDAREDLSWDAVWEAATHTDSLGWTAEFRIPLSQLRFTAGQASWGINLGRWVAREREYSFWAPWLPTVPGYVSRFGRLEGMGELEAATRLELLPYVMARVSRKPGDALDPFHHASDVRGSMGFDLRYGLSSNLTLTATITPDFGQVEGDPEVVNLTEFETRLSERRPFFMEGTSIFDFEGGEIFHSRRIGRAPQGSVPGDAVFRQVPEAATILGAAKLSGRTASGWSIGLLNATTGAATARYVTAAGEPGAVIVEPLTNYSVARLARDLRAGESTVGGIVTATHRHLASEGLDVLPSSAWVGGLDGRHRFEGGGYEIRGHLAGSRVEGSTAAIQRLQRQPSRYFQRPDARHLDFDPELTALHGYSAGASAAKVGGNWHWEVDGTVRSPGFEVNEMGFLHSADRMIQRTWLRYRDFEAAGIFRSWDVSVSQLSEWTLGRERVDAAATLFSNFELRNHWSGYAQLMRRFSSVSPTALRGGPALHQPGFWRPVLSLQTDRRRPLAGRIFVNLRLDDPRHDRSLYLNPSLDLRSPSAHLSVGPTVLSSRESWQYVGQYVVHGEPGYLFGRLERTQVGVRTRLSYTFTPRLSLELYGEPFLSAGRFDRFVEVADAGAPRPRDRFRAPGGGTPHLDPETNRYRVERDGGGSDLTFANPDFTIQSLHSNAVLRWEYRPGSTLHLVWSQGRRGSSSAGDFDWREGVEGMLRAPGSHVVAIKVSHWISP